MLSGTVLNRTVSYVVCLRALCSVLVWLTAVDCILFFYFPSLHSDYFIAYCFISFSLNAQCSVFLNLLKCLLLCLVLCLFSVPLQCTLVERKSCDARCNIMQPACR